MGSKGNDKGSNIKTMESYFRGGHGKRALCNFERNNYKKEKAYGFRKESAFKDLVRSKLKQVKDLYFFIKEAAAIRGIPDVIICYKGRFIAWELKKSKYEVHYKTKGGIKATGRVALQLHIIQKIREAGGEADFIYPENLEEKLREVL